VSDAECAIHLDHLEGLVQQAKKVGSLSGERDSTLYYLPGDGAIE